MPRHANSQSLVSRSEADTERLGSRLAERLAWGTVVALYGDLGAGKTVLTRGIARGLGIEEPVTSPTFTVVQEYPCRHGHWLYHLDMYRIDDENAALAFGIEEFLFAPNAITVVEWPERIDGLLTGDERLRVLRLEHLAVDQRRVTLPAKPKLEGLP